MCHRLQSSTDRNKVNAGTKYSIINLFYFFSHIIARELCLVFHPEEMREFTHVYMHLSMLAGAFSVFKIILIEYLYLLSTIYCLIASLLHARARKMMRTLASIEKPVVLIQ